MKGVISFEFDEIPARKSPKSDEVCQKWHEMAPSSKGNKVAEAVRVFAPLLLNRPRFLISQLDQRIEGFASEQLLRLLITLYMSIDSPPLAKLNPPPCWGCCCC